MLIKTYSTKSRSDGVWTASTPDLDRDNDRIFPIHADGGIDVIDFRANPLLFWGHDYSKAENILGTAEDIVVSAAGLHLKPAWRKATSESDVMTIINPLIKAGVLRAMSIGFAPKKYTANEFGGRDYTHVKILEVSLVGLPANQMAITAAAKAFGAHTNQDDADADPLVIGLTLLQLELLHYVLAEKGYIVR